MKWNYKQWCIGWILVLGLVLTGSQPAWAKTVKGVPEVKESKPSVTSILNTKKVLPNIASQKEVKSAVISGKSSKEEPVIRIGLFCGAGPTKVSANGPFTVYDGSKKWKSFGAGSSVTVNRGGAMVAVNGTILGKEVYIRPNESGMVMCNGKTYRGEIKIIPTVGGGGITVINVVGIESYLYGVVPSEMPASWNENALRAQAVAARTYALKHLGDCEAKGFDIRGDFSVAQEYKGVVAEDPRTTAAVQATKGEVVTYQGRLIDAVFFSMAGGYTEASETVWGGSSPYLKAVSEPMNDVTGKEWVISITKERLETILSSAGKSVGKIKKIHLSKLKKAPMRASDRGISGRVKNITIEGTKKTITISGETFRDLLQLRSTLFDFRQGKKKDQMEIYGFGFGHGVGLSQWGAQLMAEKKRNAPLYYQEILMYFYQGTKVEKRY